jgi:hypothetical protein
VESRQRLFSVFRLHGGETGLFQGKADHFADMGIVIDNENGGHGFRLIAHNQDVIDSSVDLGWKRTEAGGNEKTRSWDRVKLG